jgi:putative nucleotidyltransferase with HDIG domain
VLLLSAVYFVLNSALPAVAIGLDTRQSPLTIWRKHFLWLSLGFFAAGSVSFCLVLFIQQFSVAAIALVLPVPIIFHLTLRASFGRLEDAHRHLKDKDRLYLSTIETLAMAIDAKDDVTHSHVRRVQAYAVGLAEALGITDEATIKAIKAAALLHDTGKLAVPEHILNKPGKLTPSEFDKMKLHVDVGADILSLVDFPYPVVPIVRCHHENWDGSGYPRGVKGEDIPIGARILSVVDCYDALTSDRPYRPALTEEGALDILRTRRGTMYDPHVVDTFIAVRKQLEVGDADAPAHREVLERIGQTRQALVVAPPAAPPAPQPAAASDEMLAFVSLARLAAGDVSLADVLALSSKLLRDIVPDVSAAWYIATGDEQVVAMEASGPAAAVLRGSTIKLGDRLTGWVAANRQVVVNSDAALDLGPRTAAVTPPLASCLSVPLVAGDALAGVLTLYASARDVFTDDHGRLIQVLAPHVAQAIARARRGSADVTPAEKAVRAAADLRLVSSR